jgi:hypothetical protein
MEDLYKWKWFETVNQFVISIASIDDPNLVPEIASPVGANLVAQHVETPLILELQSPVPPARQRQYDVAICTRIAARDPDAIDAGIELKSPNTVGFFKRPTVPFIPNKRAGGARTERNARESNRERESVTIRRGEHPDAFIETSRLVTTFTSFWSLLLGYIVDSLTGQHHHPRGNAETMVLS